MSENDFERALVESFNNAYNSNIPISTSEANNVNDIFVGNEVNTECIICYEENSPCIKCFQCTAVYCKICLTKIASESNKCICAITITSNYSKLKTYNQNLIKKAKEDKAKEDKAKADKAKADKAKADKAKADKAKADKAKADKAKADKAKADKELKDQNAKKTRENQNRLNNTNNNSNSNSNSKTSLNYDYINNHINNTSNSNSNSNFNSNLSNYNSKSNNTNLNDKLNFIKDLTDNKIYNIDFKSFCNEINNTTPNFDYLWDYQNKTLTFYTIPNSNQDIKNIVIDYTILNAEYQAEIYVYILELLKLPFSQFKKNWNKIADIFPKITENNKTLLVSNIVELCQC